MVICLQLLKHSYTLEAVLRALANRLRQNVEDGALQDFYRTLMLKLPMQIRKTHGPFAANILKGVVTDKMLDAIVVHNEMASGKKQATEFQHALAPEETIIGLITAVTLVYPDKKIASIKIKSVTKRMKQKSFAASVNRENIRKCEKTGIPLNEFVELSVNAMKEISDVLGL